MNYLFIINGVGSRFSDAGYEGPKPLINVHGMPMILRSIHSLGLEPCDKVFIGYHRSFLSHNFEEIVKRGLSDHLEVEFYCFPRDTVGAAEAFQQLLNIFHLKGKPVAVVDHDVIFSGKERYHLNSIDHSAIFWEPNNHPDPIFSYIETNPYFDDPTDEYPSWDQIIDIAEKNKISDKACCGLYYFGSYVTEFIEDFVVDGDPKHNYISHIYKWLISESSAFVEAIETKVNCVGTPEQLQDYCVKTKPLPKRICFDLDNTLVTKPTVAGDYSTCEPIPKMIKYAQFLKNQGHTIIIYTARRMRTHKGCIGMVVADIGDVTSAQIKKLKIPCDELYFGKPYAQHYIDDLAIPADHDVEKELGFYDHRIESRAKHNVQIGHELVTKEGDLEGEYYWYKSIPEDLHKYFPTVYPQSNSKIIIMDIAKGSNLSHLFIKKCITFPMMTYLMDTLNKFHHHRPPNGHKLTRDIVTYNYIPKLMERERKILEYCPDAKNLIQELKDTEPAFYALDIGTIHGDPVFSNVFIDDRSVQLIDPRGKLGERTLSNYGHTLYDWAKVYQSACGYDFILHNEPIDWDIVNKAQQWFWTIKAQLGINYKREEIEWATKLLLISLIPLHDKEKANKFWALAKTL